MFLKVNYIPNSPSLAENELLVRCAAVKTLIKVPGVSSRHCFLFSGMPSITITPPSEKEPGLLKLKMLLHLSFYKITECEILGGNLIPPLILLARKLRYRKV